MKISLDNCYLSEKLPLPTALCTSAYIDLSVGSWRCAKAASENSIKLSRSIDEHIQLIELLYIRLNLCEFLLISLLPPL